MSLFEFLSHQDGKDRGTTAMDRSMSKKGANVHKGKTTVFNLAFPALVK